MVDYSANLLQQFFKSQLTLRKGISAFDFQRLKIVSYLKKKKLNEEQIQDVVQFLRGIIDLQAIIQDIENDKMQQLVKSCKIVEIPSGHVIFKKRDIADAFYVILKGTVEFYDVEIINGQEETVVHNRLLQGRCFGNKAFSMVQGIRTLSARSTTWCQLIQISKQSFMQSLASKFNILETKKIQFIDKYLPNSQQLNKQQKEKLIHLFSIQTLKKNQVLIKENSSSKGLYFIIEGECLRKQLICRRIFSKTIMGVGSFFGEESIFENEDCKYEISVYSSQVELMVLHKKDSIYLPQIISHKLMSMSSLKNNYQQRNHQFLIKSKVTREQQFKYARNYDNDVHVQDFKKWLKQMRNETAKHWQNTRTSYYGNPNNITKKTVEISNGFCSPKKNTNDFLANTFESQIIRSYDFKPKYTAQTVRNKNLRYYHKSVDLFS